MTHRVSETGTEEQWTVEIRRHSRDVHFGKTDQLLVRGDDRAEKIRHVNLIWGHSGCQLKNMGDIFLSDLDDLLAVHRAGIVDGHGHVEIFVRSDWGTGQLQVSAKRP